MKTETSLIGEDAAEVTFSEQIGEINADLSLGADVTSAKLLQSNSNLCYLGVKFYGQGFILTSEKASALKQTSSQKLIKPFVSGQDLAKSLRGLFVIDTDELELNEVTQLYPDALHHLFLHVKPERDFNPREAKRLRWWRFGENQPSMRKAVKGLSRYIVTSETAKYRLFQFIPGDWVAEGKAIVIASDDYYFFGILSSSIHEKWSLATGGLLGPTPVYNKTRCFDPFPFPDASPAQQARIRALAEQLDAHRKRQQAAHATLTLTDLYNVVEKLKKGEPLTAKDQTINQQGLASVVLSLHQQLDTAVADAYGWPNDLPESEILIRLVRLNHERAAEEQAGQIRYLRPDYQRSGGQQQVGIDLGPTTVSEPVTTAASGPQAWPKELSGQMQAIRTVVQQAGQPLGAAQIAGQFTRLRVDKLQPLLDTLTALALIRLTPENTYAS